MKAVRLHTLAVLRQLSYDGVPIPNVSGDMLDRVKVVDLKPARLVST